MITVNFYNKDGSLINSRDLWHTESITAVIGSYLEKSRVEGNPISNTIKTIEKSNAFKHKGCYFTIEKIKSKMNKADFFVNEKDFYVKKFIDKFEE